MTQSRSTISIIMIINKRIRRKIGLETFNLIGGMILEWSTPWWWWTVSSHAGLSTPTKTDSSSKDSFRTLLANLELDRRFSIGTKQLQTIWPTISIFWFQFHYPSSPRLVDVGYDYMKAYRMEQNFGGGEVLANLANVYVVIHENFPCCYFALYNECVSFLEVVADLLQGN